MIADSEKKLAVNIPYCVTLKDSLALFVEPPTILSIISQKVSSDIWVPRVPVEL